MIIFVRFLLGFMLVFTALFLILLVLIQRGRGGGLAGALGGMGGQSAFGAKAGDVFTKITVGVAAFWILLCILAVNVLGRQQSLLSGDLGGSAPITMDESLGGNGAAAPESNAEPAGEAGEGLEDAGSPAAVQPDAEPPPAASGESSGEVPAAEPATAGE